MCFRFLILPRAEKKACFARGHRALMLGSLACCALLSSSPASAGGWVYQHDAPRMAQALSVGSDQAHRYLCRVAYQQAMLPGFTAASADDCHFLVGDKLQSSKRFQVYVKTAHEQPAKWQPAGFGGIPKHAWAVGWGTQDKLLYVCRVDYKGDQYTGVVRAQRNGYCDTFTTQKHRPFYHYDVLTLRHARYAHVWF